MQMRAFCSAFLFFLSLSHCSPENTTEDDEKPIPFFSKEGVLIEEVTADLRVYKNGQYIEHLRQTELGRLEISAKAVTGRYYIMENIIRGGIQRGNRIDTSISVTLPGIALYEDWIRVQAPFPRLRPIPALPQPLPPKGTVWKEDSVLVQYPGGLSDAVFLPVTARYRFDGKTTFQGRPVYQATGFISLDGTAGDHRISGTHTLTLFFSAETLLPEFIKSSIDDTILLPGGTSTGYKGFINHWYSYPDIREELPAPVIENVELVETAEGRTIRIRALRFKPDQAVLMSGENQRLREIAAVIQTAAKGKILVIGHTADVGSMESQQKLSTERAKTITAFLVAYGIDAGRLLYEGRGGTEPITENSTEEGRKQNRRVEIILLE